ncbi:hypothetical protein ACFQ3P_05950 [Paraburkholderia sabiae]|uniref:Uncharacterized protein n=1 Tax=Paraburkholderia sabiae TaxID=273251 RepID=A0ABU9QIQ3_9BURK|nr:hypothetical protein [Paraburkholderia sabiae]WJZ76640.1 hypothetical protein QEN71_12825 [Paraburkholderia sabiae]
MVLSLAIGIVRKTCAHRYPVVVEAGSLMAGIVGAPEPSRSAVLWQTLSAYESFPISPDIVFFRRKHGAIGHLPTVFKSFDARLFVVHKASEKGAKR